MRARTKTLFENNEFVFIQHTKTKNSEKYFTIRAKYFSAKHGGHFNSDYMDKMREHFDPGKNRGSAAAWSWKFKNRKDAEYLIMTAIIKWSH